LTLAVIVYLSLIFLPLFASYRERGELPLFELARAHLARFLPPPPPSSDSAPATFTLQTLFDAVTARFAMISITA